MSIWSRIADALSAIGESVANFFVTTKRSDIDPEKSVAFTIGMIALSAKMAKADGEVTWNEVAAFRKVFQIPPDEIKNVARVFNLAKQDVAGYEFYARQLARLFKGKPQMLEAILDSLFYIAMSDHSLHEGELHFLESVAEHFGFDAKAYAQIKMRHADPGVGSSWLVLGLDPSTDDATLKRHYRKLVRDHHPDRQIAQGMPEEMVAIATEQLAKINAAYDAIVRERGL